LLIFNIVTLPKFLEKKSQSWLAGQIGVSQSAISQWLRDGVPADRVRQIVAVCNGEVSAHDLRPDLYPDGFIFPKKMLDQARETAA
jgi:DNA-binding transcriptional regulator YdaS (Cro superfamily)